ncbi:hypothetical protein VOI32_37740 [Paraburkholderia caribensis]|nr:MULTISPECIES: hypothetical protein [Paraburkholderia]MCO4882346.1 hypothetical protein [Paraburkholderia caribensis]PTB24307.1 hypothetical protein C9I56_34515 [Paraburkholderia caribensis]
MPEKPIKFDQVVHGYRDGHRQLVASLGLEVEAADAMALASDLLTSRSLRDDEDYITAYPLKSEHKYVFARTWPAPEMPRPGCVWTHSLVLDYVTVSKIDDAHFIRSLFRRPTIATLPTYGVPLTYDIDSLDDQEAVVLDRHAERAVRRVYGARRARDIVLGDQGSERDEKTALAIWSQMPPRLRRTVAFCTEPSSGGLPLEADATIRFSSFPESEIPCPGDEVRRAADTERGIRLLAKDLTRRHTTPLRRFLRRYSVDVSDPFGAIPVLAEVFLLLGDADKTEDFAAVARFLGRAFPSRRDAQLLKQDLLLGRFFNGPYSTERQALSFLGTLRAIDGQEVAMTLPDEAQLSDMFPAIAREPSMLTDMMALRRNAELADLVESCIRHVVELVPLNVLATLQKSDQQAIELARMRPELLRDETFWLCNASARKLLLRSCELDAGSVSCFIRVFRDTLDEADLEILLHQEPESVVSSVSMLWEHSAIPMNVSRMIVQQFARSGELLRKLIASTNVLPRAIWADIGNALASLPGGSIDGVDWVRILKRADVTRLERHESTLAALLFAKGMTSQASVARTLLAVSFDLLYVVAWNGALTLQEQSILDQNLPDLGRYWSWDYCRRLARAVLDAVTREDAWEVALLEMDVSPLTARGIVREIETHRNAQDEFRLLSEKLDDVPDGRRKWGSVVEDAMRYRFRFGPFSF